MKKNYNLKKKQIDSLSQLYFRKKEEKLKKSDLFQLKRELFSYKIASHFFFQQEFLPLFLRVRPFFESSDQRTKSFLADFERELKTITFFVSKKQKVLDSLFDIWSLYVCDDISSMPMFQVFEKINGSLERLQDKISELEGTLSPISDLTNKKIQNLESTIVGEIRDISLIFLECYFFRQRVTRFLFSSFNYTSLIFFWIQIQILFDIEFSKAIEEFHFLVKYYLNLSKK